ncbi:hypothetical protein JW992_14985 [candidate division KSB1 bacterium]|nr:hypothetical protein [candidate division KSB1 bacterium]
MTSNHESDLNSALQFELEAALGEIVRKGSYEAVFLFTEEGLILAQHNRRHLLSEQRSTEFALLMNRLKKLIRSFGGLSRLKEIVMEDEYGKKLIFRFVPFMNQISVLVAVVPPRKSYRGLTHGFVQKLAQLEWSDSDSSV